MGATAARPSEVEGPVKGDKEFSQAYPQHPTDCGYAIDRDPSFASFDPGDKREVQTSTGGKSLLS